MVFHLNKKYLKCFWMAELHCGKACFDKLETSSDNAVILRFTNNYLIHKKNRIYFILHFLYGEDGLFKFRVL